MIPLPSAVVRRKWKIGLAEEHVRALVGKGDQLADHPGRGAGQAAEVLEVGLALVGGEVLDHLAQVGEVEQRQAGLVGVVEATAERGLLGVVEPEHLGEQGRTERGHGDPQRGVPTPSPPSANSSTGNPSGSHAWPTEVARSRTFGLSAPGADKPDKSPLIGGERRTPAAESCSARS